jgi:putative colanic acid biosynthesis UDP-glucose lipid carrier transferase
MASKVRDIRMQLSLRDTVHRVLDTGGIAAGLALAVSYTGGATVETCVSLSAAAIIVYYLVAEVSGLYRSWRGISIEQEILCAGLTWGFSLPILLSVGLATRTIDRLSRGLLLGWFLAAPVLIVAMRILTRRTQQWLRARGYNTRGVAVVGINELGIHLARNIENSPDMGLKLLGFFDDRPASRVPAIPADLAGKVGDIDELLRQTRRGSVHAIYVTFPMRAEARIRALLGRLGDCTASVYIVPDFFVFELLHSRWSSIAGLPVVSVFETPFYGIDGLLKRLLDLAGASLLLAVLGLPMAAIALAVKLGSPGPALFRQRRYGLNGREIRVWKFRTMRVCEDGPSVPQTTKNDPRVTRLGAFLRKTSLDELPQLFNVLQGSMSLVGPRPHASTHNEEYRKLIRGYMLRHKVKPGITGLAQVNGWRGQTETLGKMEKRISCDHQYIREWSLWLDVKILLKTVVVVFSRQNAY